MKKIFSILLIGLITMILFPFGISAKSISTLNVNNSNNKLTVSGTTESGVLAVAVLVYSGDELAHMETCSSDNDEYSCELSKTFENENYTVKVADYDGGDYISKNVSLTKENPKTADGIMNSILLEVISILGIAGCGLFLNKKYN